MVISNNKKVSLITVKGGVNMKYREPIKFLEIIKMIKDNIDKGFSYCIYSKLSDSDDLELDTICYIDDYSEIADDDEEIYSKFVIENELNFFFREELVQDVITNAFYQKPDVTDQEILEGIIYYNNKDNFMDFNHK